VRAKLCLYYGDAKKFTALLSIYANSVIVCFDKSLSTLHYLAVKRCITISIHKLKRPRPSCASLRSKRIAWRAPPLLSLCAARARQNSARAPLLWVMILLPCDQPYFQQDYNNLRTLSSLFSSDFTNQRFYISFVKISHLLFWEIYVSRRVTGRINCLRGSAMTKRLNVENVDFPPIGIFQFTTITICIANIWFICTPRVQMGMVPRELLKHCKWQM
jgi:hypothetical protein